MFPMIASYFVIHVPSWGIVGERAQWFVYLFISKLKKNLAIYIYPSHSILQIKLQKIIYFAEIILVIFNLIFLSFFIFLLL